MEVDVRPEDTATASNSTLSNGLQHGLNADTQSAVDRVELDNALEGPASPADSFVYEQTGDHDGQGQSEAGSGSGSGSEEESEVEAAVLSRSRRGNAGNK